MKLLKSIIRDLIGKLGYEVVRKGRVVDINRRIEAASELEAVYRQFVFPGLPGNTSEGGTRRHELLAQLEGTQLGEAFYLLDALHRSLSLGGAVCEFGVAQGATSALIANEIRGSGKSLWLFDSFKGLPRPGAKDVLIDDIFSLGSIEKYAGTMAHGQDEVLALESDRLSIELCTTGRRVYRRHNPLSRTPSSHLFSLFRFRFF